MGSHGGPGTFLQLDGGSLYDPLDKYTNLSADDVGNNIHGVDGAIKYLAENSPDTIFARISEDTPNPIKMYKWFESVYEAGDRVIVLGYSGGGYFAINLSHILNISGYPIHSLGLIDPIVLQNIFIPGNVEKIAVYHQESAVADFQGFNSFVRLSPSSTEYFAGHPDLVDGVNHFSIDNDPDVWQDFGQKMAGNSSGNTSDDQSGQFSVANYVDVCDVDNDKWWSPLAGHLSAKYDCAGSDDSIEGILSYNAGQNQAAFAPYYEPQVEDHTIYYSGTINPTEEESGVYVPEECFLNGTEFAVLDQETGRKLDTGTRKVTSGRTLKLEKDFRMEDADAEDCRIRESLKTVETAFYVSLNDGPLDLIRGPDGERYQKTKMSNLDEGDENDERVFHTIVGLTEGDKLTYVACHDVNEDLNQPERDDCEDEELYVEATPIDGAHETLTCDEFSGYAVDYDKPEGGLTINVRIGSINGSIVDTITTETHANGDRSLHEWYWQIPQSRKDGLAHTYYFEAVNAGPGVDRDLPFASTGTPGRSLACAASQDSIVPLWRFQNSQTGSHFYTASEGEKNDVNNGVHGSYWSEEHTEGWVFDQSEPGSVPVYRLWRNYNEQTGLPGGHFFTAGEVEKDVLRGQWYSDSEWNAIPADIRNGITPYKKKWRYEEVAFWVYPDNRLGTVPLRRAFNQSTNNHFYSIGTAEFNTAVNGDYGEETGAGMYAFPALPVPPPAITVPTVTPMALSTTLSVGGNSIADRIFDVRNDFVLGEKVYAHIKGDANVSHQWRLRVLSGGSVVYTKDSDTFSEDIHGDHTIAYEPGSIGTYTVEAHVKLDSGWVSQGTQSISVGAAPAPSLSCSIVDNHSFESSPWSEQSWGNSERTIATSTDAQEGNQSGHISIPSYTNGQVKMVSPDIPVTGGSTYNLSLFAKGSVTNAYVQPISYDSSGNAVGYSGYTGLGLTNSWQEFTNTVEIPANAVTLKLEIRAESQGDLYIDDVWVGTTTRDPSCSTGGSSGGGTVTPPPTYDTNTGTLYLLDGIRLNGSETNTAFSVNESIAVAPGIINGTSQTEWVYTDLKLWTTSWQSLNSDANTTFEMPPNSAYPVNTGSLAEMITSFSTPGDYKIQVCALSSCKSRDITVQ